MNDIIFHHQRLFVRIPTIALLTPLGNDAATVLSGIKVVWHALDVHKNPSIAGEH